MTGNLLDFNPDLFPNNKFSVAITGNRLLHVRNEYMVDHANIAVSFWNRQPKGGTYACLTYFLNQGKDVHNVKIIGEDK